VQQVLNGIDVENNAILSLYGDYEKE